MAAQKQAARKPRRRDRKSVPVGQAHIKSTFNNTIISITDPSGAVVSGRETAIRSLQSAGLEVGSITDVTPQAHNGVRPPKRRRV